MVCPLNWGLGHATRCIPIIRELIEQKVDITIGGEGGCLELLKKEFPKLNFLNFPGYKINYPKEGAMAKTIAFTTPKILCQIYKEHRKLKQLMQHTHFDIIISDNRYGLWNKNAKTIFITHQLRVKSTPKLEFLEPIMFYVSSFFIKKFDLCWVPDFKGENNLSGELSHKTLLPNVRFVGPISRFSNSPLKNCENEQKKASNMLVVLSGPEPQRTIFEKKILAQLCNSTISTTIVRGLFPKEKTSQNGIIVHNYLGTDELQKAIDAADIVLSRPGYSSIMDLATIGKKAIFVPTPGQTEQEYLATLYKDKGIAYSEKQSDFNLERALEKSISYKGLKAPIDNKTIKQEVNLILG